MKIKSIYLFLLFTTLATAQFSWSEKKYTAVNISTDPVALITDNVFVIAAELERVETGFYFKAGFEYASLEGDYKFIYNSMGINLKWGYFENIRYYAGFKSGFVFRGGEYVNFGPEAGMNFELTNNLLIGIRTDYIYRGDWLYWGGEPGWRLNGYGVIVFKL